MIAAQPSFAKPVALSLDQLVDPLGEVSAKALDIIRVVHVLRALLQPGAKLFPGFEPRFRRQSQSKPSAQPRDSSLMEHDFLRIS